MWPFKKKPRFVEKIHTVRYLARDGDFLISLGDTLSLMPGHPIDRLAVEPRRTDSICTITAYSGGTKIELGGYRITGIAAGPELEGVE